MVNKLLDFSLNIYKKCPPGIKYIIFNIYNKFTDLKIKFFRKKARLKKILVKEVNVIGSFLDHTGLGLQTRTLANTLCAEDYKVKLIHAHFQSFLSPNKEEALTELNPLIETEEYLTPKALKYPVNIFSITFSLTYFYYNILAGVYDNYYNICYTPWELEYIKDSDARFFMLFDEIWTVSIFCKEVFEKFFRKHNLAIAVKIVPIKPKISPISNLKRKDFNLPAANFLFYFIFDPHSSIIRKNPFGAIEAFKKAFTNGENVNLVIKSKKIVSLKNQLFSETFNQLEKIIAEDKRLIVINENISRPNLLALIKTCDCFVSLHRSEGFGLNILEALELGKPAIATNYSGSVDIMAESKFKDLAYPVNYKMIQVDCKFYNLYTGKNNKKALWADPDLNHAAKLMNNIYQSKKSNN